MITTPLQPTIYATLAWGFAPDSWGAIGFSREGIRNDLANLIRQSGGLVLTMGTMGPETDEADQGRLLGLHAVGTRPILTEALVEPDLWADHLAGNGGMPKWPYGLPIVSAEGFVNRPRRAQVLPRLHAENLHRKLASNFEVLTADEASRVLSLKREAVREIWTSEAASFISKVMSKPPNGPPPAQGQRVLSASSGPAATYCFRLEGSALAHVARNITPSLSKLRIFKIGFSNDPDRRRRELNAYLPDEATLTWAPSWCQWHLDEINAWTMEQKIFHILVAKRVRHIKGEIFAALDDQIRDVFIEAQRTAKRPRDEITITIATTSGS